MTKYKNQIHSILVKYDYGISTHSVFLKSTVASLQEIKLSEIDRIAVDMNLENVFRIQEQIHKLECNIASIFENDERTRLLLTIPGISHITALTIISEIVDIKRFATAEKLYHMQA